MNRRVFLKTTGATAALLIARPAFCAKRTQTAPADAEILAQAKERIQQHRQGPATIRVKGPNGKPVPGAKIGIEQVRHHFLFGSNFFMFGRCGQPELEEAYRQRFAAVLNYCTLPFYWASYESERAKPNYEYTDQVAAWTAAHGLTCKGHPLVWDHPAGSPGWLPDDQQDIARLSHSRVRDIVSRFKGRINIWDVVNEAAHMQDRVNKSKMADWALALGPANYVGEHLKIARAANPAATLLVNDYRTGPDYVRVLEGLPARKGWLFDVIGIQSHMHDGMWPLHKIWDVCDTYSRFKVPLHFTETTLVSGPRKGPGENWAETTAEGEARQAEQAVMFYTTVFGHPAVQALTWWDFTDLSAWQGAAAGWLRKDMSPKPIYERLMGLIKGEWWTKASGVTDAHGKFDLRAFYGDYRVTAESPTGTKVTQGWDWKPGETKRCELSL
jgi:endo-1,4-beta-xylanase